MTDTQYDNILALDTSTQRLILAVAYGGDRTVKSDNRVDKTHGQILLKKIDELLGSAELSTADLDALVVCVGPGSFTGLRIGLAAFKGIAVANGLPVVGINLFELAAYKLSWETGAVNLLVPSRRGEFYIGTVDNGEVIEEETRIVIESDLLDRIENRRVYGLGFDPVAALPNLSIRQAGGELKYDGGDFVVLGREKLFAGKTADLAGLEPLYLQKAIAEANFERRRKQ